MSTSVIPNISFHFNFEPVTLSSETTHPFSNYRFGVLRGFSNIWELVFFFLYKRQVRLFQLVSFQKAGLEPYEKLIPCITFQARHPKM